MIDTLVIKNVKGLSGDFNLYPVTIVASDNATGKTAIMDAIRLGLLGHLPELGKTPKATFQLASAETMAVDLSGNDIGIGRIWKRSAAGAVQSKIVGDDYAHATPAAITPGLFMAAAPKARLAMLAAAGVKADNADELVAACRAALAKAKADSPTASPDDPFTFARETVLSLEAKAKEYRAAAKRHTETVRGLVEKAPPAVEFNPADLGAARTKLAEVGHAFAMANHSAATARVALERATAASQGATPEQLAESRAAVEALPKAEAALNDAMAEKNRLEKAMNLATDALAELIRKAPALKAAAADDFEARVRRDPGTDTARAAAFLALPPPPTLAPPDPEAHQRRGRALERQRAADAAVEALLKEMEAAKAQPCCPYCKSKGDGWLESYIASRKPALDAAIVAADAATVEFNAAELAFNEAESIRRQIETARLADLHARDCRDLLAGVDAEAEARQQAAKVNAEIDRLSDELRTAEGVAGEASETVDQIGETAALWQSHSAAAAELETLLAEAPTPQELANLEKTAADLLAAEAAAKKTVEGLLALSNQADDCQAHERALTIARETSDQAEKDLAATVELLDPLRAKIAAAMAAVYAPIFAAANGLLPTVLDDGATVGELDGSLGLWRGAAFVPFDVLSGSEQLLVSIALQIGLAEPGRAIVLVDEMARLSRPRRVKLVEWLVSAVEAKMIAQAVLIDPDEAFWTAYNQPGTLVINL